MTQQIDHYVLPTPTPYMPNPVADNNLPSQERAIFPRFSVWERPNPEMSAKKGMPMVDRIEVVEIMMAGQRNSQPFVKVTDRHRRQWAKEYAAWKASNQGQNVVAGMPIDIWPGLSMEQIILLKVCNVFTVQQLAAVSDTNLDRLGMGGRELREKAKKYLAEAETGAALRNAEAQNTELKQRLMFLETKMNQMNAQMSGLTPVQPAVAQPVGAPAKRRGRPPKAKPAPTEETQE